MNTAQIVKVALVLGILFALYRVVAGRSIGGGWNVQPYSFEKFDDDSDAEDDENDQDDDGEDDTNSEYDDDDGEDDIEGFSTAEPAGWGAGSPLMNIATDLLPKPSAQQASNFGEFAPKSLLGQNFLDAKKYIGVDTQGSSMRNANYDLRSSPAIPRRDIGPWAQSTIDSDLYRKPLE